MRALVAVIATLVASAATGHANPYDDCILEHMGTAQNETAAHSIQRACISKSSVPLTYTPDDLDAVAWVGNFNIINSWNYGLLVRIKNSTPYNITELVATVHDRKTNKTSEYVIDSFDEAEPTGVIITKLGEPAYRNMIPSGKTRKFFVPATEVTEDTTKNFFKNFDWNLRLSKGIPTETPVAMPAAPNNPPTSRPNEKTEYVPRWGMQLTSSWSESEAWAKYRLIEKQYAALIGDRKPIVVRSRGIGLSFAMRYNIRIADDDRAYLEKLCQKLIAAGGACVVLENDRG